MSRTLEQLRAGTEGAERVVAILSANPIHDTGGGQRSAQIALELLRRDVAVIFVSHGVVTETVDLGLRFDHARLVSMTLAEATESATAAALVETLGGARGMLLTQVPVVEWLPVVRAASRAGVSTVYDCIDLWSSELGRGWYRRAHEQAVAEASLVLTASAPTLVDRVETMTGREAVLLPNAYNARVFDPDRPVGPRPFPEGRVAIYVGALWGGWMDWRLVDRVARAHPDTTFVFVGDHRGEGRSLPPNCRFEGLKPQSALPDYLVHADLAFLPWRRDGLTEATSPLKIYEFVAMGLPVVAPAIEPLRAIPGLRLAASAEGFVDRVGQVERGTLDDREREAMRAFSRANAWPARVDRLFALGDSEPDTPSVGPSARERLRPAAVGPIGAPAVRRGNGPSISVVMPAYRHEGFVGEAVESIGSQTLPAGELVVVDDGSDDGTAAVVQGRGPAGTRLVRQANRGAHHALNRAIRLSRGEWIAILNSDDAFLPGRLERAWGVARETGAALVLGSVRLVGPDGGEVDPEHEIARWYAEAMAWHRTQRSLRATLARHNVAVTTSNFFLHRDLWKRLDGFRDFRWVHDYDFLLRSVELCPDRVVFDEALDDVRYRVHEANTITDRASEAAEERIRMKRELGRPLRRMRRLYAASVGRRGLERVVEASDVLAPAVSGGSEAIEPTDRAAVDGPRAGIVVESLGAGGLEEVVALLAQSLPAVGIPTAVACVRGGPVADRLVRAGIDVEILGGGSVASWAERTGVSVVSSHFSPVAWARALEEAGVPVVETVQNCYAWLDERGWEDERARARSVRGLVAVSEGVVAYHEARSGRAPGRVVPNAVHPARAAGVPRAFARRRLGLDPDAFVIAYVGRITRQKNPSGLLEAFERARADVRDAVLLLAGPADRSARLSDVRRRYAALFREGAVRHVSSPRHVGTVLSGADAYVSNAFYEGWSVAASEAAWLGLPLVLSETAGSHQLVGEDGARGVVVPNACGDPLAVGPDLVASPPPDTAKANVAALAEAIVRVASDRGEWADRKDAIRSWARGELSPGRIARSYAEVLRAVAR